MNFTFEPLLEALHLFFDALLSVLVAFFKKIFRGVRNFPYYITGTNPFVFSKDSNIEVSLYSRVQVHLFGWMSVSVVIYIFGASQKIATQLNFLGINENKYKLLYYVFSSIIFSTIVFFFERFILSNPRIKQSAGHILWKNIGSKKAISFEHFIYWPIYWLINIRNYFFSVLLLALRASLSLIIAGLISVTILFQINESQVKNKLNEVKSNTTNLSIKRSSEYRNYKPHIEKVRQKYFEKEAQSNCLRQAEIGKTPDFSGVFNHKDINMEAAPKDVFVDIQSIPTKYICPLKSPKPCRSSTGKNCPEVMSITKALKKTNKDYRDSLAESKEYEAKIKATVKKKNINVNDFSGQVQALALYYKELYDGDRANFFINIGIVSPFLIILLLFELLPTIAKLTFPHSSYDRLIADEELFYELKSMALINDDASIFFEKFSLKFKEDLNFLKQIKIIEYEKKQEFSSSVENFIDSFKTILLEVIGLIKKFGNLFLLSLVIITALIAVGYVIYTTLEPWSGLFSLMRS